MSDHFFTISQLNQFIKDVVNAGFPQPAWVCGEIQQYDRNKTKKHVFFELVEKDPQSHEVIARIGLVIFAGQKILIDDLLRKSENGFELKDDIEVKFACRVDFYPPHGAIRLIVESIDPVYTLGKMAQSRQKLIALLKEKGTLDKNKTLDLPLVPLRIGLITAFDSAAYNDFMSELKRSGFYFQVYNRNTQMQGKGAERDVCNGLKELSKIKGLDVIVITRGGGSIADLSCFDSQMIAESIAGSSLPILSGIGHEINTTITDLAAHTYMKTPTAIAQFLVDRVRDYVTSLEDKGRLILDLGQTHIREKRQRLKDNAVNLNSDLGHFFKAHHEKLIRVLEVIKNQPKNLLKGYLKNLNDKESRLLKFSQLYLASAQRTLDHYAKMIEMVHPMRTLRRGFSIARRESGKTVKSIEDVSPGEKLTIEIVDGIIETQVTTGEDVPYARRS